MNLLQSTLLGGAAFRDVGALLAGLTYPEAAQTLPGAPYSVAELLEHLRVTMRVSLDLASGKLSGWPDGLDVWPAPPSEEAAFEALLGDIHLMLAEANMLAGDPSAASRDILTDLAVHNAYHWGQVALLRQQQGADFDSKA